MSFSKVPFSRFCDKNVEQRTTTGRVVAPQDKDKTKPSYSTITAPRPRSKSSLNRQRNCSYTTHQLQQQEQPLIKQQQLQRIGGRIAEQCSTLSVEGTEDIWVSTSRNPSRSQSRDGQRRASRALSNVSRLPNALDDTTNSAKSGGGCGNGVGGGGGGGGGGGAYCSLGVDGGGSLAARQAQNAAKRRVMETQFSMKSKRFAVLRKEVVDKQRTLSELHHNLIDMYDRLQAVGAKEVLLPDTLPWVEVEEMGNGGNGGGKRSMTSSPTPCRMASRKATGGGESGAQADPASSAIQLSAPTEEAMQLLEMNLKAIPHTCLEMCRDTINKRNEVLNWFSELDSSRALLDDEMRTKLDIYRREGVATDNDMEAAQGAQQEAVAAALATLRSLAAAAESARAAHEEAVLDEERQRLHSQHGAGGEGNEAQVAELERALEQAQEREQELEAQLAAVVADLQEAEQRTGAVSEEVEAVHKRYRLLTNHLGMVEGNLKEERMRLRGLEPRLVADEVRIQQLNAQMSRVEAQQDLRLKVLADKAREQDEAARLLAAQKETLERRIQDLGALIAINDGGDKSTLNQMNELREEIQMELEKERELRNIAQENLKKEQARILELEEKIQHLTEALQSSGNVAKEKSSALAQELETMKKQLSEALKKVTFLQEERVIQEEAVCKLETRQAREHDDNQKLNAELQQMAQQLVASEAMLREARDQVAALECQVSAARAARPLEKIQLDYQKKVSELQEALKELMLRSEEMERVMTRMQKEAEQRECVLREQNRVVRVRDELIVLLKSNEQRQEEILTALQDALREKERDHEKIAKKLSEKTAELQSLNEAMKEKQLKVSQLETLVEQLKEQQERSQEQRTRQEARISSLETRLQAQETPQRYARPAQQSPASYFFWDGQQLQQIERIPPGAAQAPRKGTFYLTVTPKPHANPASDSAKVQFYVKANIGERDVEEGLGTQPTEEALSGAAVTSAADATAETGRRVLMVIPVSAPCTLPRLPPLPNAQSVGERRDTGWPENSFVHGVDSRHLATSQLAATFHQDDRPFVEDFSRPGVCPSQNEVNTTQSHKAMSVVDDCDGKENQEQVKGLNTTSISNSYAGTEHNQYQMRSRSVSPYATGSDVGFQQSEVPASYWRCQSHLVTLPSTEKRQQEIGISQGVDSLRAGSEETNACPAHLAYGGRSLQSTSDGFQRHNSAQTHACTSEVFPSRPAEISSVPNIDIHQMDEIHYEARTSSPRPLITTTYITGGDSSSNDTQFPAQFQAANNFQNGVQDDSFVAGRPASHMGKTPKPNCESRTRKWYPRKYQEGSITKQHGDATTIHDGYHNDESCLLLYQNPDSYSKAIVPTDGCSNDSSKESAPWFAFRLRSPTDGFFLDSKRETHSYVILPGGDYSQDESRSRQQQQKQSMGMVGSNRLPLCSNSDFEQDRSRTYGGEREPVSLEEPDQLFSMGVENANEDLSSAVKWTNQEFRLQWALPTIDEVNSEIREQSEEPPQHLSDSEDSSRRLSPVTPESAKREATVEGNTAAGLDAPQEGTEAVSTTAPKSDEDGPRALDFWCSRRAEYGDVSSISTDASCSPRSSEDDQPQMLKNFNISHSEERAQSPTTPQKESAHVRSNVAFENNENGTVQRFPCNDFNSSASQHSLSEEHMPQTLQQNGITTIYQDKYLMDRARNLVSSSNCNKEQFMLQQKPEVSKCLTVVTNSNGNIRHSSNLHLDTSLPTNLVTSHKPNHTSLSTGVFKNAQNVNFELWNDGNISNRKNSFSKMRHTSDTSSAQKASIQLSTTLFDMQRRAGANDSNMNSSFFTSSNGMFRSHIANTSQQASNQPSLLYNNPDSLNCIATISHITQHSPTNSSNLIQYFDNEQPPDFSFSSHATTLQSTVPHLKKNTKLLSSKSGIQLSKYNPIHNIMSKHCMPQPTEKVINTTHIRINPNKDSEDLWKKIIPQKLANTGQGKCTNKKRHSHKSKSQCVSIDRYPMDQIHHQETDILSEASYLLHQIHCGKEDFYETDALLTFHDPIYISMQCLETCDCHGKACNHFHR